MTKASHTYLGAPPHYTLGNRSGRCPLTLTIPRMLIYALLACAAAITTNAGQVPLVQLPDSRPGWGPAETYLGSPEFNGFIEEVMRNGSIPGISLGVVRLGKDKEPIVKLGSWGRKTEDGDGHDLSPDVRIVTYCGYVVCVHPSLTPVAIRCSLYSALRRAPKPS